MRVKICGVTRAEDALLASELGAWAVGFVFWPGSPRHVGAAAAEAIARQLPAQVARVGVFVDQPLEDVREIAGAVGLTFVQLHGAEPPAFGRALARPVIKAVSLEQAMTPHVLDDWAHATLLVDGRDPARPHAGGRVVDWARTAEVAARRDIVLAGGLKADNVAEAIRAARPRAVDVSSGVERAPGVKDARQMRAFFAAVAAVAAERADALARGEPS